MSRQEEKYSDDPDARDSPLSVARKWLPWCLVLIFLMTIGWTALVAWEEVSNGDQTSLRQATIAVVHKSAPAAPFIVMYAIMAVSFIDALGGSAVVTAQYLRRKFLKPLIERQKAEGHAEGRTQGRAEGRVEGQTEQWRLWTEWNQRRMEAEATGVPFDELPPGEPSGGTRNGDQPLA